MSDTYFLLGDSEAQEVVNQVLTGFDRFKHIKPEEVLIVYKVADKSRDAANIRRMPKLYSILAPGKKILLMLFRPNWESLNTPKKIALVYHEFIHIGFDEKKSDYRLVRHDVEDFREMIQKLGFEYEKAADLIKEMKPTTSAPKVDPEEM